MHIRRWLALGLMLGHVWVAAETVDSPPPLSLQEAQARRARGKALKREAQARYEIEKAECQSKVIAIVCMNSAKERRTAAVKVAEAMEREGRQAERESHRREFEAKAAKVDAETPGREAQQRVDVERYRENEARRAVERERRRAEEPAKLEERRGKLAAERAAWQNKLEKQRKDDAQRAARAPENARKRAQRERQHAERVKKIDERARRYAEVLKRRAAEEAAGRSAGAAAR